MAPTQKLAERDDTYRLSNDDSDHSEYRTSSENSVDQTKKKSRQKQDRTLALPEKLTEEDNTCRSSSNEESVTQRIRRPPQKKRKSVASTGKLADNELNHQVDDQTLEVPENRLEEAAVRRKQINPDNADIVKKCKKLCREPLTIIC